MLLRTLALLLTLFVVVDLQVLNIGDLKNLDPKKVAEMIKRKAAGLDDDMDFSTGARKDNPDDDDDDDEEGLWAPPAPKVVKKEPKKPKKKAKKSKKPKEKTGKITKPGTKKAKKAPQKEEEVNVEPDVVEGEPIQMKVVDIPESERMEPGTDDTPIADDIQTDTDAPKEDLTDKVDQMDLEGETDPNIIAQKMAEKNMRESRPGETVITYSPPILDDEEQNSAHMPAQMKCDGCQAVVWALFDKFEKFNEIHKYRKFDLPESDVIDLTEQACDGSTYESYGIKTIEGVKRLSGPGLDTSEVPGVTAGGGKWPSRLRDMCETFMGEIGEMAIYSVYKKNPKSRRRLEDYLCRGKGLRGECNKKPRKENAKDEL